MRNDGTGLSGMMMVAFGVLSFRDCAGILAKIRCTEIIKMRRTSSDCLSSSAVGTWTGTWFLGWPSLAIIHRSTAMPRAAIYGTSP
jgi:hypothetical protein